MDKTKIMPFIILKKHDFIPDITIQDNETFQIYLKKGIKDLFGSA